MKSFKEFLKQKMHNEQMDMPPPAIDTNPAIVKSAEGDGSMKSYMPTKFPHPYKSVFDQPSMATTKTSMAVEKTLTNATDLKENDPRIQDVVNVIKNISQIKLDRYHLANIAALKELYLGHDDTLTGNSGAIRDGEYRNKKENWKSLELSILTKDALNHIKGQ